MNSIVHEIAEGLGWAMIIVATATIWALAIRLIVVTLFWKGK